MKIFLYVKLKCENLATPKFPDQWRIIIEHASINMLQLKGLFYIYMHEQHRNYLTT